MRENANENEKLKMSSIIRYSTWSLGYGVANYWASAFFAIFCTDVIGIRAGIVSGLILFCRCFDVVNDPIIGNIVDKSKYDKDGNKYARWVRFGATGFAIITWMLFSARPNWSNGAKVIWVCVMYCIATIFATATDIPYGSMNNVLSNDASERTTIARWRSITGTIGGSLAGGVLVPMVEVFSLNGEPANGYFISTAISAIFAIAVAWFAMHGVKERVRAVKQEPVPFRTSLKAVFRNRYIAIFSITMFGVGFFFFSFVSLLLYYFTYYAENVGLMAAYSVATLIAGLAAQLLVVPALERILCGHKGRMLMVCGIFFSLSYGLLYFIEPDSFWFYIPLSLGYAFLSSTCTISYSLLGDACDYGEYKFGVRSDALAYSIGDFTMKLGGAVGPALILAIYDMLGYVPNQAQNANVLMAMRLSISAMPFVIGIVILIASTFYNLSPEIHKKIVSSLKAAKGE